MSENPVCDTEMVKEHTEWLHDLRMWAFGSKNVKGASNKIDDMEKSFHQMNTKMTIVMVFMGLLIIATVPDLLKLFGLL